MAMVVVGAIVVGGVVVAALAGTLASGTGSACHAHAAPKPKARTSATHNRLSDHTDHSLLNLVGYFVPRVSMRKA